MTSVRLRVLVAAFVGAALTFGSATAAVAFTAQPGFSATTYATGYPTGAPAGVAFVGTTLYTADPADGGLYATALSGTLVRVATIAGTPTALAAFGPSLYALQSATNAVVQIDPATGSVLATLGTDADFGGHAVSGIATDPRNGDLYVSTAPGWTYRIPALAPRTAALAFILNGYPGVTAYGIALDADGTIYIAVEGVGANGVRQITTSLSQSPIGPDYVGARGLGVIPGYIFVNNVDGSITKIVIPGAGTGSTAQALTGGDAGGLASIGTDGCFYAAQGPAVIRLASADGSCNLANAAPPPPPPSISLSNTSGNLPLIGNGDQTFLATLGHVSNANGIPVSFTVTRGSSSTTTVVTSGPNGMVNFGYSAATPGIDVVTASAVINGTPVVSNAVTLNWLRPIDTAAPTITATVTGGHNAGAFFSCPNVARSTPTNLYCGWFTGPATVRFTITANGPSGLDPATLCPDVTLSVNSLINGTPITCGAQNGDLRGATSLTVWLQTLLTPPTITASAATPSGAYVAGTATNQNVTVSFACASDPALIPTGVSSCTAPVTVSAEGTASVTGTVVDLAGTARTVTFGPIVIDRTAPIVTATMKTATDGLPYTPGTPTTQNVIVTFTCVDAVDPNPTCPGPLTVTSSQTVSATTADHAGNTRTSSLGQVVIDRTGPTVSATVTPTPDVNGNNSLSATVNVTASDPSGVGSITYSAAGAQPIASTTVTATGNPGSFTVPIALNVAGTTVVTYTATDRLGNVGTTGTTTVKIVSTQPTTLTITSAAALGPGTPVTARLLASGAVPVAGQTITFTAGVASAAGVTDASGSASAVLQLAPGTYTLRATFGGTSAYVASAAGPQTVTVSAATQFVIWGGNPGGVQVGQRVIFWGEHWWDQVLLAEKLKVKDFKGWADTVNGATWTSKGGDSRPPETIATYISVIITNSITRAGGGDEKGDDGGKAKITGNVVGHAILRVDSPYKNEPGKPVYGVVIAVTP